MSENTYHFVYKITCTLNNKYYIGVHSTSDINDGYMGSGTILKHAIKKHGKNYFKRQILFEYPTRSLALEKEAELVNINVASDPESYNIALGGNGNSRLRIKCSKKFKKENPIFIEDAPEIEYKGPQIPFDQEYQYIFQFSKHKYKAFKLYRLFYKPTSKIQKMLFDILTGDFAGILDAITTLYNDKINNKAANKFINRFHQHGLFNYIEVVKVKRDQFVDSGRFNVLI